MGRKRGSMSRRKPEIVWDSKRHGRPSTAPGAWSEGQLREYNHSAMRALVYAHPDMAKAVFRQRLNGMTYYEAQDEIYERGEPK